MILISVPIYVCATGSIPIAAALLMKGLNPGAAFVFLLAGPATNAVTITVITKYLGKRTAVIYISTLIASSIAFGLLLDAFWSSWNLSATMHHHGHQILPHWLEISSAVLMIILLTYVFVKNSSLFNKPELIKSSERNMLTNFTVSGMTCNNFVMHVEKALKKVDGVENVVIDLGSKKLNIEHTYKATMEQLKTAVINAGYSVD